MSNFVIEFPQRSNSSSFRSADNFVAEFKRNPQIMSFHSDPRPLRYVNTSIPSPIGMSGSPTASQDDVDVRHLLSEKNFSKQRITQLLHDSIVSLVEKLLTGRTLGSVQGQINISLVGDAVPISLSFENQYVGTPVVEKRLNDEMNINLKSNFPQGSEHHNDCRRPYSPESIVSELDSLDSPIHGLQDEGSGINSHHTNVSSVKSLVSTDSVQSLPRTLSEDAKIRRDSDEESGYNSNNDSPNTSPKQTTSSYLEQARQENVNSLYCQDGRESQSLVFLESDPQRNEQPGPENSSNEGLEETEMSDADELERPELMIDLSVDNIKEKTAALSDLTCHFLEITSDAKVRCAGVPEDVATEGSTILPGEKDTANKKPVEVCHVSAMEAEATKDLKEKEDHTAHNSDQEAINSSCSDTTDVETDAPTTEEIESSETSISPHPQSMVTKLANGLICKFCHKSLPNADAVASHALDEHNLFSCTFCFRTFTAKNNLKRHTRLHTGLRPYKCTHCSHSFARRDDLKGHMLRHDYSKPFRCAICKKGYTDRACVKNHMAKEHGSRLMHVCPQCGESFDKDEAFSVHKQSHPELKQYSCKVCFFIGNNNLMTLKHSLIHEHGMFSCKPCNAFFADPFDYTNHVRKHKSNPAFTSYVCCFCKVTLSSYDQFVRHEYSHAQGKTYCCEICKKQFKSKAAFQDHAWTHSKKENSVKSIEEANCNDGNCGVTDRDIQDMGSDDSSKTGMKGQGLDMTHQHDKNMTTLDHVTSEGWSELPCHNNDEVLDLSVRKDTTSSMVPIRNEIVVHTANGIFQPSAKLAELNLEGVPRDGYTSELAGNSAAMKYFIGKSQTTRDTLNCTTETMCKASCKLPNAYPNVTYLYDSERRSANLKHASHYPIDRSPNYGSNSLRRSVSGDYSRSQRMSPYSREKFLDLASKFVAARGPFVPITKRPLMKSVNSFQRGTDCGSTSYVTPSWLSPEEANMNTFSGRGVSGDGLTRSSLLKHDKVFEKHMAAPSTKHLPTFIKTEPLMDIQQQNDEQQSDQDRPTGSNVLTPALEKCHLALNRSSIADGPTSKAHCCEICKEMFPSFQELENHSVAIHKKYLCEHCGKDFTARPNRDRHVRYHTGERPYRCDLCHQAFHRGDDLKYHRTTRHPSAQPFACNRCMATFTWSRDLERHIRQGRCKVDRPRAA